MSENCVLLGSGEEKFDGLQAEQEGGMEDELDAFNDETFGGDAEKWEESEHQELAELTEQEKTALKQSEDFFEFGSDDGEEIGGELEDEVVNNGNASESVSDVGEDLVTLSLKPDEDEVTVQGPQPEQVSQPNTQPLHTSHMAQVHVIPAHAMPSHLPWLPGQQSPGQPVLEQSGQAYHGMIPAHLLSHQTVLQPGVMVEGYVQPQLPQQSHQHLTQQHLPHHLSQHMPQHLAQQQTQHLAQQPTQHLAQQPSQHMVQQPTQHMPQHLAQQPPQHLTTQQPPQHLSHQHLQHVAQQPPQHLAQQPPQQMAQHPPQHLPQQPQHLPQQPQHMAQQPPQHMSQQPPQHMAQQPPQHMVLQPPQHMGQHPPQHLSQQPPHVSQQPPPHVIQQPPQPAHHQMLQQQPQQFPLLPPSHFQPPPAEPDVLQDPAIMSLSKLPPGPPALLQYAPPVSYTQLQTRPQYTQSTPSQPLLRPSAFSPPPVRPKTMQDVEQELLYGRQQHRVPPLNPQHHNMNYPGMRDRQHQPVQSPQSPGWHEKQRRQEKQHRSDEQQRLEREFSDHQHRHEQHHHHEQNRHEQWQDHHHHQNRNIQRNQGRNEQRNSPYHLDRDDFRNENRDDFRNERGHRESQGLHHHQREDLHSATRPDLMPGHVHVLGILRHSRSRQEADTRQDTDYDLEADSGPLLNPTGDPLLDRLQAVREAELAAARRRETEDEYAGLMSQRDKQWIINIQLSQLKCDNPYIDDYYYTVYTARQEVRQAEDNRDGPQLVLNNIEHEQQGSDYIPKQFENSLGKLQCVTVKAPRRIIDVGVVLSQEGPNIVHEGSPAPGAVVGGTVGEQTGANKHYKQVLLQIEKLYTLLLETEDDEKMLSALPTGTPLREQVEEERANRRAALANILLNGDNLSNFLEVRKGRSMLLRSLRLLPELAATSVYTSLLGLATANTDNVLAMFWPPLARHIKETSVTSLESLATDITHPEDSNHNSLGSILASSLSATAIVTLIAKAATAAKNGDLTEFSTWQMVAKSVLTAVDSGLPMAKMLPPVVSLPSLQPLLSPDSSQAKAWQTLQAQWIENMPSES